MAHLPALFRSRCAVGLTFLAAAEKPTPGRRVDIPLITFQRLLSRGWRMRLEDGRNGGR